MIGYPARARPHAPPSAVALLVVTVAVCAALATPWAASLLAARSSPTTHTTEDCLAQKAETVPVRINVGTYRPPQDGHVDRSTERIESFSYLVTLENSGDPDDPDPANHPGVRSPAGSSAVLLQGVSRTRTTTLDLPRHCRWLVTIRANRQDDSKGLLTTMYRTWGAHVDLVDTAGPGYEPRDADANGDVVKWVELLALPLPSARLVVHVFPDTSPTNGKPDLPELAPGGLAGFAVTLHDVTGRPVTRNARGDPLCSEYARSGSLIRSSGGLCSTGPDGSVVIPDLPPGTYDVRAIPPQSSSDPWHGSIQTTTQSGGPALSVTLTEADDGTGAARPGHGPSQFQPTAHRFGFVRPKGLPTGAGGRILGCATHQVAFPPYDTRVLSTHEPIESGWIALSRVGRDQYAYAAPLGDRPTCSGGAIDIRGIAEGSYTMFIWEQQLERVSRTIEISVTEKPVDLAATRHVDEKLGEVAGDDGRGNIGLVRRSGWLSGHVFDDTGVARDGTALGARTARNGLRDCTDRTKPATCERGLEGEVLTLRWRDGSVKRTTSSDTDGRYEFPNELSSLSRFVVGEAEAGPGGNSGPCLYSEATTKKDRSWPSSQYNPQGKCVVLASNLGGGRTTSQLTTEGHRSTVDFGTYAPADHEVGQISGVVYYASTRRDTDPRFGRAEPDEPGIPGIPVNVYWTGTNQHWDGGPGSGRDDVLVWRYAGGAGTDAFVPPSAANQGANGGCAATDSAGNPVYPPPQTHFGLRIAPHCLEFGVTSNETKDGTFDGRFAVARMCDPAHGGWSDSYRTGAGDRGGCARPGPLVSGDYVVEVVAAENTGSPTSPYAVVKEEDVNAPRADVAGAGSVAAPCVGPDHVVADPRSPFDGTSRPLCTHRKVTLRTGGPSPSVDFFLFTDTPIPGRIEGVVTDSMRIETDPSSAQYGRPRAVTGIPVGIRDYAYRLLETIYTDEYGHFEAILPSNRTAGCSTRDGGCSATYLAVVNDIRTERALTGAVRASETRIVGTRSHFLSELEVGDHVRVGGDTRVVTSVPSDTVLSVDRPWGRPVQGAALHVLSADNRFDPTYATSSVAFDVRTGKTTYLETALDPTSTGSCPETAGPELHAVAQRNGDGKPTDDDGGLVLRRRLPASSELREVTIRGLGFGTERTIALERSRPGYVTIVHPGGARHALDDDAYYGGHGSPGWSDERITFRFPRTIGRTVLPGAPYEVLITAPGPEGKTPVTTPSGITLHYIQAGVYEPDRRYVDGAGGTNEPGSGSLGAPYRTIQYAIDRAAAERAPGRLIMVLPGVYRENPVLTIRAKLQGYGPGSLATPVRADSSDDDARQGTPGTVVDASLFNYDPEIQHLWQSRTSSPGATPAGAGITVVGAPGTYEVDGAGLDRATIDGFAIHSSRMDSVLGTGGGGGIFVDGNGRDLWLTNNVITGNHGLNGGGITLGRRHDGEADTGTAGIRIAYNRIAGNGGTQGAGGVAIYGGGDGYTVEHNDLCANVSAERGGAISHDGRSEGGRISENLISFNSAGEGGGLSIVDDQSASERVDREGVGRVTVEGNVLSSNRSTEAGGAISVRGAVRVRGRTATADRITVVNNQLTNNVAGGSGGAVSLVDAPNVWLLNNTVAKNASTASCESCLAGPPHSGGLSSRLHSDWLAALLPPGSARFSSPLLLNNLFYGNASRAFDHDTLLGFDREDPTTFVELRDFEVLGQPALRFTPWHTTLSTAYVSGTPADATNAVFARNENPFVELATVRLGAGYDARTGLASVTIELPDPAGLRALERSVHGDYHLCDATVERRASTDAAGLHACSPRAVQAGVEGLPAARFAGTVVPAPASVVLAPTDDIDGDARADGTSTALITSVAVEIGADELVQVTSTAIEPRPAGQKTADAPPTRVSHQAVPTHRPQPVVDPLPPTPTPDADPTSGETPGTGNGPAETGTAGAPGADGEPPPEPEPDGTEPRLSTPPPSPGKQ